MKRKEATRGILHIRLGPQMPEAPSLKGVRAVAVVEAAKGGVVLLAGLGLLTLVHQDVQTLAELLVGRLHLNLAKRYPHVFIDAASHLTDARLWLLAGLAMTYAIARAVEAYGLWRERRWAEWFALVSGSVYVPIEVYEISRGITGIKVFALAINTAVVAYMGYALYYSRPLHNTSRSTESI